LAIANRAPKPKRKYTKRHKQNALARNDSESDCDFQDDANNELLSQILEGCCENHSDAKVDEDCHHDEDIDLGLGLDFDVESLVDIDFNQLTISTTQSLIEQLMDDIEHSNCDLLNSETTKTEIERILRKNTGYLHNLADTAKAVMQMTPKCFVFPGSHRKTGFVIFVLVHLTVDKSTNWPS